MEQLGYRSLQQLADEMGVNRGNVWRWFNLTTRPSVDMIPIFAKALRTTPIEIMIALEVMTPAQARKIG
jgi:transcriptional regulator with XRE-family HTH domain